MVTMKVFLAEDGSIDFPSERATCRKMKRRQAAFKPGNRLSRPLPQLRAFPRARMIGP